MLISHNALKCNTVFLHFLPIRGVLKAKHIKKTVTNILCLCLLIDTCYALNFSYSNLQKLTLRWLKNCEDIGAKVIYRKGEEQECQTMRYSKFWNDSIL